MCLATPAQEKAVVDFVKKRRNKRFCTCNYIRSTMKLKVTNRTISNTLNRHGYFWRPLPKVRGLSAAELAKRKAWVDMYLDKTPAWWQEHMGLVLDGVTLTMAPKPLSGRERHMAQSIKHACLRIDFRNSMHQPPPPPPPVHTQRTRTNNHCNESNSSNNNVTTAPRRRPSHHILGVRRSPLCSCGRTAFCYYSLPPMHPRHAHVTSFCVLRLFTGRRCRTSPVLLAWF